MHFLSFHCVRAIILASIPWGFEMADYSWNYPIQSNDFALSIPQLNHAFEIAGEWRLLLWLRTIWNWWYLLLAGGLMKIGCKPLSTLF